MNQFPSQQPARRFHSSVSPAQGVQVSRSHESIHTQPFRPLPAPTGKAPYHLSLEHILPADKMESIRTSGHMVFHTAGDTGGIKAPQAQQIVMMHMEDDFALPDSANHPAFFYHLGDVVYYYGEASNYYGQLYEPTAHYPAPIFAIPGNHDGDVLDGSVPSLAAFVENFCAKEAHLTQESGDAPRDAMTQPNVYWTLEAPFATIIGLYTNVPDGGKLDDEQIAWLEAELEGASIDVALIVAMHHPIYSADGHHSGSEYMGHILDQAMQKTGRVPDLVLSGHVHNYQRFTHLVNGRSVPYIVAGAGGYWNLHYMLKNEGQPIQTPFPIPGLENVTLEQYCDNRHGYLKIEVTKETLKGEYFTVPRPQESWRDPATLLDSFTLDLKEHRLM